MPNGNDMLNEVDFENAISKMSDRALSEFTARQVYEICQTCPQHTERIANHDGRIASLENRERKNYGVAGGVGGGIATVLGGALLVVLKKLGIEIV